MKEEFKEQAFSIHSEYIRRAESARFAVLMIHGILGTPNFFRDFVKEIPESFSVYNVLLDGHGGSVDDFSATSMAKWKAQIRGLLDGLYTKYEKIILVGHSMGTLFSIDAAVRRPDKITAVYLLASPLKVFVKPITAKYSLKLIFNKTDDDPILISAKEGYGIAPDKRLWKYAPWVPRFIELLAEIRKTRKLIPLITTPTYVFQSKKDKLVSIRSCEFFENNKNIHLSVLESSSHQCYSKEDKKFLICAFKRLFSECALEGVTENEVQ